MIISASRRTDIPAFFTPWFMDKVEVGYCTTVNPYNLKQVSKIPLNPDEVDVIVFWTRNAAPILQHLDKLDKLGFRYYFQYTITGYPDWLEPRVPEADKSIEIFRALSEKIGKDKVIWRYDPIVLSNKTDASYHMANFSELIGQLDDYTERVVVSILDYYRGAARRLKSLELRGIELSDHSNLSPEVASICEKISECTRKAGLEVYSCAEMLDLSPFGISRGKCIDDAYIERVFGSNLSGTKDKHQREECGCIASRDIGAYDTCKHECVYCYATRSPSVVRKNSDSHEPESPSIVGRHEAEELT